MTTGVTETKLLTSPMNNRQTATIIDSLLLELSGRGYAEPGGLPIEANRDIRKVTALIEHML